MQGNLQDYSQYKIKRSHKTNSPTASHARHDSHFYTMPALCFFCLKDREVCLQVSAKGER